MSLLEMQNEFGIRLKVLRRTALNADGELAFRTQEDFAEAMGVSVNSVKKWESGSVLPDLKHLFMISELLDCDIDYLTGRIDYDSHAASVSCEYTGLSAESINILHEWSKTLGGKISLSVLSALIFQKKHFKLILSCAWSYFSVIAKKAKSKDTKSRDNVIVIDTSGIEPSAEELHLFMASNNLVNCIREAGEEYQK